MAKWKKVGNGNWNVMLGGQWINERSIPFERRPWRPFAETAAYRPDGTIDEDVAAGKETFFANSHYLVFLRWIPATAEDGEPMAHLSLRTVENDVRHDWRDMQRIKNELLGPEWEAVELYPAESRRVDTANQYHLWCFPFAMPFGFNQRFVVDTEDPIPVELTEQDVSGRVQRPLAAL